MRLALVTKTAVLVALSGCGGGSASTSEPASWADRKDAFVEELRDTHPNPSYLATRAGKRSIIAQGENVCGLLSKGFTPDEIRQMDLSGEMDAPAFEPLLNAARKHLCPTNG